MPSAPRTWIVIGGRFGAASAPPEPGIPGAYFLRGVLEQRVRLSEAGAPGGAQAGLSVAALLRLHRVRRRRCVPGRRAPGRRLWLGTGTWSPLDALILPSGRSSSFRRPEPAMGRSIPLVRDQHRRHKPYRYCFRPEPDLESRGNRYIWSARQQESVSYLRVIAELQLPMKAEVWLGNTCLRDLRIAPYA
jgi:hypothetical protein